MTEEKTPLDDTEKYGIITDEELEEIGVAYGSRERYEETRRNLAVRLSGAQMGRTASVPGGIGKTQARIDQGTSTVPLGNLSEVKNTNIVGKVINTPGDAAQVLSVFRDPRIEIFNIVYTSKTGEVLAHTAWTSGLPSQARGIDGDSLDESINKIIKIKESSGADKIWLSHNHPTGNPEPSKEDINLTLNYSSRLGNAFAGHIVVNGYRYSFITPEGIVHEDELGIPVKEFISKTREQSETIRAPSHFAQVFNEILTNKDDTTVCAVVDSKHRIVSWSYLNSDNTTEIKNYMRISGGASVVVLSNNDDSYRKFYNAACDVFSTKNAIYLDVIKVNRDTGFLQESFAEKNGVCNNWQVHESQDVKYIVNNQPIIQNKEQSMEKRIILAKVSDELTKEQEALFVKDTDRIAKRLEAEEQGNWKVVDQILDEWKKEPDSIKGLRTKEYKNLLDTWEKESRKEIRLANKQMEFNTWNDFLEKYYPHLNYGAVEDGYYLYPEQIAQGQEYDTRRLYVNEKGVKAGDGNWKLMNPEHEKQYRAIEDDWDKFTRGGGEKEWKEFEKKWLPMAENDQKKSGPMPTFHTLESDFDVDFISDYIRWGEEVVLVGDDGNYSKPIKDAAKLKELKGPGKEVLIRHTEAGFEKFFEKYNKLFEDTLHSIANEDRAAMQKPSESPPLERRNINSKEQSMSDLNETAGEQTFRPSLDATAKFTEEDAFKNALNQRKIVIGALKNGTLSCLPMADGYADTKPAINLTSGDYYHGSNLLYLKEHQKQNGFPTAEYVTAHQIEKAQLDNPEIALKEGQKCVNLYLSELNKDTDKWDTKNIQLFNIGQTTNPQALKEWAIEQEQKKIERMSTIASESYKPPEPKQKGPGPVIECTSTEPEKYLGQYLAAVSLGGKFKANPEQAKEFAQKMEDSLFEKIEGHEHSNPFKLSKISNEASRYCKEVIKELKTEERQQKREQTQSRGRGM